ncbi:MAG: hypothetical protein ACFE0Q_19285 [Anaerolineae bacterium]
MSDELIALISGVVIGAFSSIIGASVSYWRYIRPPVETRTSGPLGIMVIITGTLVLIGVIALTVSIFANQLYLTVLTGMGVFIGCAVVFAVFLFIAAQLKWFGD